MVQVAIFDKTMIDHEELKRLIALETVAADKSMYIDYLCFFFYRNQLFVQAVAEYLYNTLFQRSRREVELFDPIVNQRELYIRVSQDYTMEFVQDMTEFHIVGLEEIAPCRHIEEKILHRDRSSLLGYSRILIRNLISFYGNSSANLVPLLAGGHFHLSNSSNGSQSFSTKALSL